ncbi:MAG: hypothetical protein Q7R83_04545 [bacterium]|nr:hypothetical protein [bacterium]
MEKEPCSIENVNAINWIGGGRTIRPEFRPPIPEGHVVVLADIRMEEVHGDPDADPMPSLEYGDAVSVTLKIVTKDVVVTMPPPQTAENAGFVHPIALVAASRALHIDHAELWYFANSWIEAGTDDCHTYQLVTAPREIVEHAIEEAGAFLVMERTGHWETPLNDEQERRVYPYEMRVRNSSWSLGQSPFGISLWLDRMEGAGITYHLYAFAPEELSVIDTRTKRNNGGLPGWRSALVSWICEINENRPEIRIAKHAVLTALKAEPFSLPQFRQMFHTLTLRMEITGIPMNKVCSGATLTTRIRLQNISLDSQDLHNGKRLPSLLYLLIS